MKTSRRLLAVAVSAFGLGGAGLAHADFEPLEVPSPLGDIVENLDVNKQAPDGSTPLHWAVYEGDVEQTKELIRAGADVNHSNNYGANAMQLAAEVANAEMLEVLLEAGADPDSPNPEGQTALMLVARTGNVEAAKLLLDAGATIDARESWGEQTALMWASARNHPAMMDLLIREGADINANSKARDYKRHLTAEGRAKNLDTGGLTPLMYAVRSNCRDCVDVLIEHDVNLDKPDPDGVSPVLLAILNSNWDIAAKLIENGADVNQWDIYGQAPLIAAVGSRRDTGIRPHEPQNKASGLDIVRLLLENGANPNMQLFYRPAKQRGGPQSRGTTPLIRAAANADLEVMELLIEHGAEADRLQADRQSPVSALAGARGPAENIEEGLRLLVEHGGEINIMAVPHHLQRSRGGTPFHYAVRSNNVAAIRTLVDLGGDINADDIDGLTPLDYAMARGQVQFLQMRQPPNESLANELRELGATKELEAEPFWPNVGPPFYYPWHVFPLDPVAELNEIVPGSIDHQ